MVETFDVRSDDRRWVRKYPLLVKPSCDYPKHNVAKLLIDAAEAYPNREALDFLGRSCTYKQLLRQCRKMANALKSLPVSKGDRIAIMLPNCPQAVISYYGALMAGAVVVQADPSNTESELQRQLADSGATTLIALDERMPCITKAREHTALKHVVLTTLGDGLPFPYNLLYPRNRRREQPSFKVDYKGEKGLKLKRWSSFVGQAKASALCEEVDADEDLALLQYAGGETNESIGVMLTHANLLANTEQMNAWSYRLEAGKERFLAALPMFHAFGLNVLLHQAVSRAATLLLLPGFEPELALETIRRRKPTVFPGAPAMFIALLYHPQTQENEFASVRLCISGAAPLPLEVQERFERLTAGQMIESYGLTEASAVTHCNPIRGFRKNGTIGLPLPDTDARIVGEAGWEPLAPGEAGELAVRGPQVMKGYWNRPNETKEALQNGWLRTGDIGTMDEDGYFTIIGRKRDIILTAGYRVYPREVEEVLFEHPAIKEAFVVSVPDAYRGEAIKALVVAKDGWQVSEMQLDRWCRERLAAYKAPSSYEFRDSLPLTQLGKVMPGN